LSAPRGKATNVRVWTWVKRQGRPVKSREVATALGVSPTTAAYALLRLRVRGAVDRLGRARSAVWITINPRADVQDRSGLHPNSLANLRPNWARDTSKPPRHLRRNPEWPGMTTLEQLWQPTLKESD
jgi:hypothetical protein